jgi:hypothetical protein
MEIPRADGWKGAFGAEFLQDIRTTVPGSRPAELDETRMYQCLHSFPVPASFSFVQLPLQIPKLLKYREVVIERAHVTFDRDAG